MWERRTRRKGFVCVAPLLLQVVSPLLLLLLLCGLDPSHARRVGTDVSQSPRQQSPSPPLQRRNLQTNDNDNGSTQKCYDILQSIDALPEMSQDQYLAFLAQLNPGVPVPDAFRDLPSVYVLLFYTLACDTPSSCRVDIPPTISLGNDNSTDNGNLQFFCKVLLKQARSETTALFEYSIRYDTSNSNNGMDEEEATLATCLGTATVNILLDQVADCETLTDIVGPSSGTPERQLLQQRNVVVWNNSDHPRSLQEEEDEILGQVTAPASETCPYSISSIVQSITNVPCDFDQVDVEEGADNGSNNKRCGLVRQTVSLIVPQRIEPFEELLRVQVVSVLRDVINSGSFVDYFPPDGCFL